MRFKTFLQEARHRQDISVEKAVELLKASCKDALKFKDTPLLRGTRTWKEEAYLVQGELGGRSSAHSGSNHYTVILDEVLPEEFPRRSKSLIIGNYKNSAWAASYGTLYAIFPFDGVPLGLIPERDIFDVRFKMGKSRERGMNEWNEIFEEANVPDYSFEDIISGIEDTINDPDDDWSNTFSDAFGNDVEGVIRRSYAPANTGMKVITSADIGQINNKAHELWVGGKCIAIHGELYEDEVKKLL